MFIRIVGTNLKFNIFCFKNFICKYRYIFYMEQILISKEKKKTKYCIQMIWQGIPKNIGVNVLL